MMDRWPGAVHPSTAPPLRRKGGCRDRPGPNGSRKAGDGRPRKRHDKLHADKAYDHHRCRGRVPRPLHRSPYRPSRPGQQRKAGPAPLGCRTNAGMAQPLSPSRHPLRTTRLHPRGLRDPRLRPHLPQSEHKVLSGVLKQWRRPRSSAPRSERGSRPASAPQCVQPACRPRSGSFLNGAEARGTFGRPRQ